ncbi:Uncharacterised protein [Avibacterium volantium]|uniref:Uncharacterized protein n=1 Tax=Avibacterium volantium TaxID=762 RepID=A0A447SMS9_AVIVO|nr:Uncharacterised protein [Avibacterium volantium]
MPDSLIYPEYCHSYDVLDVREFKYFRINHSVHFV